RQGHCHLFPIKPSSVPQGFDAAAQVRNVERTEWLAGPMKKSDLDSLSNQLSPQAHGISVPTPPNGSNERYAVKGDFDGSELRKPRGDTHPDTSRENGRASQA